MCCTCPSRGFGRIAVMCVQCTHTVHNTRAPKTLDIISLSAVYFEKILFITFSLTAHVFYIYTTYLHHNRPWTATDCILKCLPVGSESIEVKHTHTWKKKRDRTIWSIPKLNTRVCVCVCALARSIYQIDRMNTFLLVLPFFFLDIFFSLFERIVDWQWSCASNYAPSVYLRCIRLW